MNAPNPPQALVGLDMIRRLVAFDTTSRNSNLELIEWVRDHLAGFGIDSRLTFDDARKKANLFATVGPERDGGIVLSGHTDVVPVDGQPWSTPPFEATLAGDRLHGRGVCDMKGFVGIALAFVPEFLRRDLPRPVHLALSYDEEVGCIGVRRLIADLDGIAMRPAGCVVGEPTGMRVMVAHKGKHGYRCRVRGFEVHSSLAPHGVNAVEIACEIVGYLRRMARRFREEGGFDAAYEVPHTTVHTGVIHGGTALNIVPRECWFDFEFRHLPFDDPVGLLAEVQGFAERELLPAMRAIDPDTGIRFERLSALPGFDTSADTEIATIGRECAGTRGHGKVSFATEASLFFGAGIPAVICGPGHVAQAHQPDEWVSLDQLAACETFMRRLGDRLAAP